jgi:chemotaxis protein MotB
MIGSAKLSMVLLGLAALPLLTGCNYNRVKAERDALWEQNQELQDKYTDALAALDAAENELAMLRNQPAPAPVVVEQPASNRFADIEGVETFQRGGDLHVRVPGDVLFASGKVDLRSSAKQTLNEIASVLQSDYATNTIRIEGYTDTDPIRRSNWKDNLELSLQRAAAVHRYLQSQGISADRMYAAGFGETRPAESKQRSRRVEIVVVE